MTSMLIQPQPDTEFGPPLNFGPHDLLQPMIDRVTAAGSLPRNRYRTGGLFRIEGWRFGDWAKVPADLGLFLIPRLGGSIVRVDHYYHWRDGEIEGLWPLGLRGAQRLVLETRYEDGGPLRTTTYPYLLLP